MTKIELQRGIYPAYIAPATAPPTAITKIVKRIIMRPALLGFSSRADVTGSAGTWGAMIWGCGVGGGGSGNGGW